MKVRVRYFAVKMIENRSTYCRIPRPGAKTHRIIAHTQTADTVLVTIQAANPITSENIPNL